MVASPSALEPDSIFAKDFRVVRGLRLGGMGAVYIVTQLSTGKQRALKLLASQLVNNTDMRERFVREAQAAAEIESDHVVEIVTAGVDDDTGTPYICMELLRGEELADAVDRRGAFPLGEVRIVLEQIGDALAQAHAQRIVHRDLKPENIFLALPRRRGIPFTAKLLDFGVAKFLALGASELGTAPVGSPLFMAPEQTDSFGNICPATDVWALGLLAFYLLTGKSYWLGAERASVPVLLREVCLDPLVAASHRAHQLGVQELIPEGFDAWFNQCVVREIDRRFVDGGQAIDAFLEAVPEDAEPDRSEHPQMVSLDDYDPYAIPPSGPQPGDQHLAHRPTELPVKEEDDDSLYPSVEGLPRASPSSGAGGEEPTSKSFDHRVEDEHARPTPPGVASEVVKITAAPEPLTSKSKKLRNWLLVIVAGIGIGATVGAVVGVTTRGMLRHSHVEGSSEPSSEEATEKAVRTASVAAVAAPNAPCPKRMILEPGGHNDEAPVEAYCLDRTEVTVHAFGRCVTAGVCDEPTRESDYPLGDPKLASAFKELCNSGVDRENEPQNCVDWWSAATYCQWMGGRLPTEEEWTLAASSLPVRRSTEPREKSTVLHGLGSVNESSAKAGTSASEAKSNNQKSGSVKDPKIDQATSNRCGEECLDWGLSRGVFLRTNSTASDAFPGTAPVGSFAHGAPGAVDLDGNVAEWTLGRDSTSVDGSSASGEPMRAVWGAAFMPLPDENLNHPRTLVAPSKRSHLIGFRCVVTPVLPVISSSETGPEEE